MAKGEDQEESVHVPRRNNTKLDTTESFPQLKRYQKTNTMCNGTRKARQESEIARWDMPHQRPKEFTRIENTTPVEKRSNFSALDLEQTLRLPTKLTRGPGITFTPL